jgi:class 3 adenylate cyclase
MKSTNGGQIAQVAQGAQVAHVAEVAQVAEVINFPVHKASTIDETLAGFPAWAATDGDMARRSEYPVTMLFADVRGWATLAARVGVAETETTLGRVLELGAGALKAFGGEDVTVSGETDQPVISAGFSGTAHALRAIAAATELRDVVARAQLPALPGHRLEVCTGLNTGAIVETEVVAGARVAFRSVGTIRIFALRLQEFAGPGQIFLSTETYREVAGQVSVRSIGHVRTNGDGETQEAFCLTAVMTEELPSARAASFRR